MEIVELLIQIKAMLKASRNFYIRFVPEVLDFTNPDFKAEMQVFSARQQISIPINRSINLLEIFGLLKESIFGPDVLNVFWNVKNLFSYLKYVTHADFEPGCQLIDLKAVEGYLGVRNRAPEDYGEAVTRLRAIYGSADWAQAKSIYQKIHVPLITKIVPSIEAIGLLHKGKREAVHPYYEIEGQVNGRMKCHEAYMHHFNPHGLSEEVKSNLVPRQIGDCFIVLDFRHFEVNVLQWLSRDEGLLKVIESSDDFYKATFKLLGGGECDSENKRDLVKKAYLPVIYGKSVDSLAKELNVSFQTADKIVSRERTLFSRSFQWIEDFQNQPGEVRKDYHGRLRTFEDRVSSIPIRNFAVQSPASLVSLEKLIQLYEAIKGYGKIICHVHDGYVLCAARSVSGTVCSLAKEALESASDLCPGLKLKCSCKVGATLNEVKEYNV